MPGRAVVGVDEAGKGPAVGSMFAAAVRVPESAALPDGVDDSKRLTPERREALARDLRDHPAVAIGVAEVPVERIDAPGTDMNSLTVAAHATAIEGAIGAGGRDPTADAGTEPSVDDETTAAPRVLADACDTDAARFAGRVADALAPAALTGEAGTPADDALAVEAEHGADERHAVVAAASVVAKVERDAHVAALADEHGDVGSGYPSDPTTREFLQCYVDDNGELPACARSSWKTCRRLLAQRDQRGLGEF
jgi:ribonuclease HII